MEIAFGTGIVVQHRRIFPRIRNATKTAPPGSRIFRFGKTRAVAPDQFSKIRHGGRVTCEKTRPTPST